MKDSGVAEAENQCGGAMKSAYGKRVHRDLSGVFCRRS